MTIGRAAALELRKTADSALIASGVIGLPACLNAVAGAYGVFFLAERSIGPHRRPALDPTQVTLIVLVWVITQCRRDISRAPSWPKRRRLNSASMG